MWVRICTEEVAVAASAPHLPFHSLLTKTMAASSSFCSPAGREGVLRWPEGRWEGAQHGCGQQKLFPLPKLKKLRALLLPSCPREPCAGDGPACQEDCGCLLLHPTAIECRRLAQHGAASSGPGRGGKCVMPNKTSPALWRRRNRLGGHLPPLRLPGSPSHSTGTGTSCFLFSFLLLSLLVSRSITS